jgi:hypothetical protein
MALWSLVAALGARPGPRDPSSLCLPAGFVQACVWITAEHSHLLDVRPAVLATALASLPLAGGPRGCAALVALELGKMLAKHAELRNGPAADWLRRAAASASDQAAANVCNWKDIARHRHRLVLWPSNLE